MITIDKLLVKLLSLSDRDLGNLPRRDLKVLRSLQKIILGPNFITENQGRLLIKILRENFDKIPNMKDEILENLNFPSWSKSFRPIDKTKKLYISSNIDNESKLIIEFAFSSTIRKLLTGKNKEISGLIQGLNGKLYHADLTEKNIVALVDLLEPLDFEIEEKIQDFYRTIKSWSENEVKNQFFLENFDHTNFQKFITSDLGIDTPIDYNIVVDRSNRYYYFLENSEKNPENLTEKIAYRKNSRVWVDKNEFSLDEIFASLIKLKRLPTLVIFNQNDHKKCLEDLVKLQESLEKNGINENVGIYFRLPNDETGSKFNKFIADNQYNCQLDENTKIVGVQNGKIPKFFLKNPWTPMSVISVGGYLKMTKTSVYSNKADLIITYTEQQPIIETRSQWA